MMTCHNIIPMMSDDSTDRTAQNLSGINSTPTLNHCPSALHKFLPSDHEVFFLFSFVFYQPVRYCVLPGRRTQFQECYWLQCNKFKTLLEQHQTWKQKQQHKKVQVLSRYKDVRTRTMNLVKKPNTCNLFSGNLIFTLWFQKMSLPVFPILTFYSQFSVKLLFTTTWTRGCYLHQHKQSSTAFTEILEDTRELKNLA